MKRSCLIASGIAFVLGAGEAEAGIFELSAQGHGGYSGGGGLGGDQQDETFAEGVTGPTYGARVGMEFLFVDGWIEHNQYAGSGGLRGTWTQFMGGLDFEFDLGKQRKGADERKDGTLAGGYSPYYSEFGLAVGFGVGTGQQVDPPLDNSQVTDKGFLGQVTFGVGYRFNRILSAGVQVPVQVAYMFKSDGDAVANDRDNQYVSLQATGLVNLRIQLPIK